jgi:hypothetical protein
MGEILSSPFQPTADQPELPQAQYEHSGIINASANRLRAIHRGLALIAAGSLVTAGILAGATPEGRHVVMEVFAPDTMEGTPLDPAHSMPTDRTPQYIGATEFSLPKATQ